MIITIPAEKDTYITNIKGSHYDASLSNVGHAATLDLFKLHNENKNSYSWALFEFEGLLSDSSIFTLEDANGERVSFFIDEDVVSNVDGIGGLQFGTAENTKSINAENFVAGQVYKITASGNTIFTDIGASDNNVNTTFTATGSGAGTGTAIIENAVIIGINGASQSDYPLIFKNVINSVELYDNSLSLRITAYNNSSNQLLLKQDKSGKSGDTLIALPPNMISKVTETLDDITYGKFARIDFSAVIIKFNLQDFKTRYMSNTNFNNSAFNNLSAEIILKDVTAGHTKPKSYDLDIYSLNKSFEEGTGKDTIYFSDSNILSNFISLDKDNNWKIPEFISEIDDISQTSISSQSIIKGDEDLTFDVTSYIKSALSDAVINNAEVVDKGFLVKFPEEVMFDKKSYFVKRTGSRHLINKSLVPVLQIKFPEHENYIPKKTFVTVRYLNNNESFYLYNILNGNLAQFVLPDNNIDHPTELKFKIVSKDKIDTFVNNIPALDVVNYKGNIVQGIKSASITNTQLSRFDNTTLDSGKTIKDYIVNKKLECLIVWYTIENQDVNIVLEEELTFNIASSVKDNTFKNLLSKVKVENFDLNADGNIVECSVFFIDTRASHEPVKLPFDLPSVNIGEIQYQIINNDTGKIILDFQENTKAIYDGEKYIFNVCFPEIYKNFNIKFNFKIIDYISQNTSIIYNKTIFRIQ